MAARAFALAALLVACSCLSTINAQRYLVIGDDQYHTEPWSQLYINYTLWAQKHPLYAGDVVVFKYFQDEHNVWQLSNQKAWKKCDFSQGFLVADGSAGVGTGFWVTVLNTPQYFADGTFGYCELGQQIIIKATLGPLPTKFKNIPVPAAVYPKHRAPPPPKRKSTAKRPPPPAKKVKVKTKTNGQ